MVAGGDLLDELLQALRPVDAHRCAGAPHKVEGRCRPQLDEFKHSAEKSSGQVFSLHSVIANNGRVHIHKDDDLLILLRVLVDDVCKILGVFHRIEDVCLHKHVVVVGAVMNDGMPGSVVTAKAIVPLSEVHKLPRGDIPQVADAWTVLLAVPVQVVIEEEHAHSFIRISAGNSRYHFCIAVRLLVFPPYREARGCHVQVREVLA
mmetsp:Transcript_112889/g.299900  ORF Transcript_112889/g.299900 Transcript_112889/m.299900 type:complete len:205 (+) Transcript_112889:620-1234(+)